MRARALRSAGALVAVVLSLQACTSTTPSPEPTTGPVGTTPPAEPTTPAPTGSTVPTGPAGSAVDVVRLRPPAGGSFLVRGRYPFAPSDCA
ncbi:MAG TPA: hypothetical protein VJ913_12185, partial [Actinomycetota bacterium]|nr:hypothetical protein [Actinomycetota bacterium]